MSVAELYELIAKGETERVEMTRAFDKADKIGQAICAFANDFADSGEAGILLLGVENNGEISGRRIEDKHLASLGGLKSDGNLFPPPSMSVEKLALPEGDVVAVTVFPSRYPPIKYNGQVWIRLGARKALANEEDIHLLVERRSRYGIRDEELPCDRAKFDELEIDLFKNFYLPRAIDAQVIEADDRPILEQMTSLRFFNQEKNCPTNLGALLFAKHPERFIPSAYIQYVKFAGDDNASDILQESVFRGPLVKVVQDLDVFVKTGPAASRPVLVTALREEMVAQNGQIKSENGSIKEQCGTIKMESGQINGQIKPQSGQIKMKSGQINGRCGKINDVDNIVFKIVCEEPGIKAATISLEIDTPERTVRRSLMRLVAANKIEYRGSKKTGGWYVRT